MKRIAENIVKAVLNTFKAGKESIVPGIRYYDSNPRETESELPTESGKYGINVRGDNSLERAYATGNKSVEIQYC